MVDRSEIAILGAGFNSIYACYRKLKDGKKVKLFLDGKKFGASMNSIKWKDNTVDLGAHNLDLRTKIAKSFFSEILDDDLLILKKPIFGSLSKNKVTNGIEFANFDNNPSYKLDDLIKSIMGKKNRYVVHNSLEEHLYKRFGDLLFPFFEQQVKRFTSAKLSQLSKNSIFSLDFLSRIFFECDAKMEKYKLQSPSLDNAFAVSTSSKENKFLGLNAVSMEHGYPKGGLGTFCRRAEKYLLDNGAIIVPGEIKKINLKKHSIEIVDNNWNIHVTEKVFSAETVFGAETFLALKTFLESFRRQNAGAENFAAAPKKLSMLPGFWAGLDQHSARLSSHDVQVIEHREVIWRPMLQDVK